MENKEIEEFEEKIYDLSNIGIEDFYLVIEENQKYIYSKNKIFWINEKNNFVFDSGMYYIFNMSKKDKLVISEKQYLEISDLLNGIN